jgi:hypothetical protein
MLVFSLPGVLLHESCLAITTSLCLKVALSGGSVPSIVGMEPTHTTREQKKRSCRWAYCPLLARVSVRVENACKQLASPCPMPFRSRGEICLQRRHGPGRPRAEPPCQGSSMS